MQKLQVNEVYELFKRMKILYSDVEPTLYSKILLRVLFK